MHSQLVLLLALLYAGLLFWVAWRAERVRHISPTLQALTYALSLAVYCSSWTFFAAAGRAANSGWDYLPIYLGPVLMLWLAWPFIRKLSVISQRNRVTSIADFLGSRYGKHQGLASLVTLLALVGTLPYIALQLKAVTMAWQLVGEDLPSLSSGAANSLIAAIVMACFAIAFGTRTLDGPRRHQGLIAAVAVESLVKLIAFALVALFAWQLLTTTQASGIWHSLVDSPTLGQWPNVNANFITQTLLAAAAIVCLPRQYHLTFVEHHDRRSLRTARWLLPLYLTAFSLLVVPIALAGQALLSSPQLGADDLVMRLPLAADAPWVTALAFLGGLSAATGMVVVAAIALSTMISNEWVVPLWLKQGASHRRQAAQLGHQLRTVRRLAIVAVLLLGWLLEQLLSADNSLPAIGLIAFASAIQVLPALLAGLYWPRGHRYGVLAGLTGGALVWLYCLLLPALLGQDHALVTQGPGQISWLAPTALLGIEWFDPLTRGVFWSLLVNTLLFVSVSRASRFNALDIRQAAAFTQRNRRFHYSGEDFTPSAIEVRQLQPVLGPLMGEQRAQQLWQACEQKLGHRLLPHDQIPQFMVTKLEASLAAIVGAVSAQRTLDLLRKQQPLQLEDWVNLVGHSNRQVQFSQELLQTTLETIPQGVSVVDAKLQLVAWNSRYETIFNYPPRLLYVGCPIEKVYEFNASRGLFAQQEKDLDAAIGKRLHWLARGEEYRLERRLPDQRVIDIRGIPLANGGYVTTYTDISDFHSIMHQLTQARDQLEDRVSERTSALIEANQSLQQENQLRARVERELQRVYASKTRFLAAASHDLAQPINAARLFVAALEQQALKARAHNFLPGLQSIGDALACSEQLIDSLREIARLDSGKLSPKRRHFCATDLLAPLAREFTALAHQKGLTLRWVDSRCWLYSDPALLRRIVQNFLSNAVNYTQRGKILLGCRRARDRLWICVWDTGPGINSVDQARIFEEFERLDNDTHDAGKGLGLGLSIAQRSAQHLGHELEVHSAPGRGALFRIAVPLGEPQTAATNTKLATTELTGLQILCVDNEPSIRAGLVALLQQWGCQVTAATDLGTAIGQWHARTPPDVVIADYHLDRRENGLELLQALSLHWQQSLPGVVISADNSDPLRARVDDAGHVYLSKPVQPAALRSTLRNLSKGH